jgi:septum formation protein
MPGEKKLILASRSPRRKELLTLTGIPFGTGSADIDETFDPALSVEENVMTISKKKAETVFTSFIAEADRLVVLGSDTTVVLDNQPLGKPGDFDHAFDMLSRLQGRQHEVVTGFCILDEHGFMMDYARTIVEFGIMTSDEITRYIEIMQPFDKAGSYGIQDPQLACFVNRIDGCYYNVVGLPVSKVFAALKPLFPCN